MGVWAHRPGLRWLLPGLATLLVLGGVVTVRTLTAAPSYPPRTAEQLLTGVYEAQIDGFSGTVVQRYDLGLLTSEAPDGPLDALLSGTRTSRISYAGLDQFRLTVLDPQGQFDVIRDGSNVWLWDSRRNEASHLTLPASLARLQLVDLLPSPGPRAAQQLLTALAPTTQVTVDGTTSVAGRPAYQLTLTPTEPDTLISRARLAIDVEHHLPMRVQVYGTADEPAIDVRFTQIDFSRPAPQQFRFNPPPGASVAEPDLPTLLLSAGVCLGSAKFRVVGEGWTSVLIARLPEEGATELTDLTELLPQVDGAWGSGRLFTGTLFSLLLTDDGRLLAGPVTPERLFQVAAE